LHNFASKETINLKVTISPGDLEQEKVNELLLDQGWVD
jgi:hypothetical protein